jgi:hypothetical protein
METANRRASDHTTDSKVRVEILEQLSEVEDAGVRVMLTLMLRLQDETNIYFSTLQSHLIQIHGEIAKLQRTDDQIREAVLNGHTTVHEEHHRWIDTQIEQDAACRRVLTEHGTDGLCHVARQALEEREVAKRRKWKVQDGIAEKAGLILFAIFAAILFPHLASYFK